MQVRATMRTHLPDGRTRGHRYGVGSQLHERDSSTADRGYIYEVDEQVELGDGAGEVVQ